MKSAYLFSPLHFYSLILFTTLVSKADSALAQASNIVPDNTLGDESSQVIENFNGQPREVITGGAQREQNLFHSFQEFNVKEGRSAYFNSPNADIQNIFSRITGNNPSEIMGVLGTFGLSEPNLFLLNPNGIIFGANSSLDVRGSFVATTANGIEFGEQESFDAINPQTPPLLTINPSAYLFNQIVDRAINGIESQATLIVPEGENLVFLSGDINLIGSRLIAPGGRIELGGLQGKGEVRINSDGGLTFPDDAIRGDIFLSDGSLVEVTSDGGGFIDINAQNLELSEGSIIRAGIGEGLGNPDTIAGNINISAKEKVILNTSDIINRVAPFSQGMGGDINIQANSLVLKNPSLDPFPSVIQTQTRTSSTGNAGNINIDLEQLTVQEGSRISTSTFPGATGNGGNLTIRASESLQLIGNSAFEFPPTSLLSQSGGMGDGGNVTVETNELIVRDGAGISTQTFAEGQGGNLTIISPSVRLIGTSLNDLPSGLFSISSGEFTNDIAGDAGDIKIKSEELTIVDGASIDASTNAEGKAGDITIEASDFVKITGSSFFGLPSRVITNVFNLNNNIGTGNAGILTIKTEKLIIQNRGQINTDTLSEGNAGLIKVTATELLLSDAGLIVAKSSGSGNAGNINLTILDTLEAAQSR